MQGAMGTAPWPPLAQSSAKIMKVLIVINPAPMLSVSADRSNMIGAASLEQKMAWDRDETEYHLTRRGWETGDPPSEGVETWLHSTHQQSGWSKYYVDWVCQWGDPNVSRADRDQLRAKYKGFL